MGSPLQGTKLPSSSYGQHCKLTGTKPVVKSAADCSGVAPGKDVLGDAVHEALAGMPDSKVPDTEHLAGPAMKLGLTVFCGVSSAPPSQQS